MFRPVFRAFLLILLLAASAWSQHDATASNPSPSGANQTAPQPGRKFMMWRVTSPEGTAYLLGSIHMADKKIYPLPRVIEDSFVASKTLVVEINMKTLDQQQLSAEMMQAGMYPEGDGLSKHVPKAMAEALDAFCARHTQIPRVAFERFRPWMAALMIGVLPFMEKGEDPNSGIDMHFMNELTSTQHIQELESADFQLKLLSSFSEEEQVKGLDAALKEGEDQSDKLERAYFAADQDTLLKMIEEDNGSQSATQKLIYDRNPKMADGVESCMKIAAPCFVVVGAAHLIGDHGVVHILQDRHYRVEQVAAVAAEGH
jgi:uncharacterized protein YbaP (TraB family)